MMPETDRWFIPNGFQVWHVPGISRAWRFEFMDGSFLLVTNLEGFDLPEPGGPYSATMLSMQNDLIEFHAWLRTTQDIFSWFRHATRLQAHRSSRVPMS